MSFAKLDSFLQEKVANQMPPGLSIALVQDGAVVWERGFGSRDLASTRPATPETLYGIASVTKSFTCIAMMQLAEQGQLSLDDPVSKHLPAFNVKPGGETILLGHLMSHASGLPALGFSEQQINAYLTGNNNGLLLTTAADMIGFVNGAADYARNKPGERYYYLNEGFILLGAVIEQVSGQSYTDYVTEHILQPLGMTRSFFDRDSVKADHDAAIPYVLKPDAAPRPVDYVYGGYEAKGGLISNVQDLGRYIGMFLGDGTFQGQQILTPASLAQMTTPRVATSPFIGPFGESGYGYGLRIVPNFYGHRVIEHAGSVGTACSDMAFCPEKNCGVIVLANGSGYPVPQMALYALALLLEHDPDDLYFIRHEQQMAHLTGTYRTYQGTMEAVIQAEGDILRMTEPHAYHGRATTLLPERLDENGGLFVIRAAGVKTPVEFSVRGEQVEMLFERYLFRKVGE